MRLTPLPASQAKQLVDQIVQLIQVRVLNIAGLSTQSVQATMTRELMTAIPALPQDAIKNIVQQATNMLATKTPLTNLNDIVNSTALTPSIQATRSPVEGFMRQILTQGTSFAPPPAARLSAQIMTPPANTTQPLTAMTLPATAKLSLMPLAVATDTPAPATPLTTPMTTPPSPMKPGSFMDARVHNFVPVTGGLTPAHATPTPMILQQQATPATMTAQVITITPQQFPVLSLMMPGAMSPQLFTLNFPATNLLPGSSLMVMPQPVTTAPLPALPPTAFELLSGFKWPVFDEFLDLQNIQFPNATTQSLANILPTPEQPGKIPAAALLFIAAVKAGDLNSWLGEKNIDALRRTGKAEFVSRMMREFSGLNKLSSEPVTPEWRGMSIPMFGQEQIDKIHIYYRHSDHGNDKDQEQAEKGQGTRFIMDMNLSQMGDVQLDGYTRGKVLDLAVRTKQPFSPAMRYEMTRRYIHTLEVAGMSGGLVFQSQPDKFIKITPRPDLLSTSI